MNRLIVIAVLLLLSGCSKQYKCIDGVIYMRVSEGTWKISNMFAGERCVEETQK